MSEFVKLYCPPLAWVAPEEQKKPEWQVGTKRTRAWQLKVHC